MKQLFLVSLDVPAGSDNDDAREYILDATKTHCGGLHPEYEMANLDRDSVLVTYHGPFDGEQNLVPIDIEVGQTWYAKLEGDIALSRLKIIEITNKTVAVKINNMEIIPPPRYMWEDIVFVEKQA